ncbi:hypothetical protein ACX1HR_15205 [Yersinia enterocolitica]
MAISVVICGLVRDKQRLLKKIQNYSDWRDQGLVDQIVYSTWIGEVDSYSGLRRELEQSQVTILEIEEPRLVLKGGHQLHQMVSFYYGLSALNNQDQFVLKTRVDLADNHESMLYDFANGTPLVDDFAGVGLKHKILVENALMMYPFLCGDAQFFGHIDDLKKTVNMSAEMEIVYNRLAVEQTFFFQPFSDCKIFKQHFYWNLPHISEIADRRDEQVREVMDSKYISDALKAWWLILDSYFKVGWGEYDIDYPELHDFNESFEYSGASKIIDGNKTDIIVNQRFIASLNSLFTTDMRDMIKGKVAERGSINMFNIEREIFDEYQRFLKQFSDLPSPKATCSASKKLLIHGAAQHFFVKDENDSASKRYHEQVTALRRENDFLRKELNVTISNSFFHRILSRFLPRSTIVFFKYKMPRLTDFYARYLMRKKGK